MQQIQFNLFFREKFMEKEIDNWFREFLKEIKGLINKGRRHLKFDGELLVRNNEEKIEIIHSIYPTKRTTLRHSKDDEQIRIDDQKG
jgi:hypothetical protein